MPQTLSYETIWTGFIYLEHLIFILDFVAWLDIEFNGDPDTTSVSLLKEPKAAHDARVDAYLAENKQEVVSSRLLCSTCGTAYFRNSGHVTCPTERIRIERIHQEPQGVELPSYEKCDTPLVEIFYINESEDILRERAGFAIARQGDIVSRRFAVCA